MEKIAVLLAVYNGREWIDEQLQSILEQQNVELDIYISVDLSSDGSYDYLVDKYSRISNILILPYGKKFGSARRNFYRLVSDVKIDKYSYISFSDQDDIWHKLKLSYAVDILKKPNIDAYSSNVVAFWDDGKKCLIDKAQPQVEYDYLFEAAGPGCTYVFKNKLAVDFKSFLLENTVATSVELHDWLLYAFARVNGFSWYIDNNAYMQYRQHSNNQVGANTNLKAGLKRVKLVREGWYRNEILKLCEIFIIDNEDIYFKLKNNNFSNRFNLLLRIIHLRRRNRDRIVLGMLLIFNLL